MKDYKVTAVCALCDFKKEVVDSLKALDVLAAHRKLKHRDVESYTKEMQTRGDA